MKIDSEKNKRYLNLSINNRIENKEIKTNGIINQTVYRDSNKSFNILGKSLQQSQ